MSESRSNFGKDLERAFSEGIENNNWTTLNNVIVKGVDNLLDDLGDKMNEAVGARAAVPPGAVPLSERKEDFSGNTRTAREQRKLHAERQRVREEMERERRERRMAREAKQAAQVRNSTVTDLAFPYKNVGKGSTALCVSGGIGLGISGVALVKAGITGMITGMLSGGSVAVGLALTAFFSFVLIKGIRGGNMSALSQRYARAIGKRTYIDIPTLALSMNRSEKKVIRELKRLIDAGYFPQGRFDRDQTTFILTDEVFDRYLELEKAGRTKDIIDTTARSDDEQEFPTLSAEESAELSGMIREGNEYIARFHALNDKIPGIEISAKLDRFEGLLKEIFVSIKKHPEQMSRIHELMDYYLPTAEKLVSAYKEYDSVSEPGKDIISAKKDIENTLDTINAALSKLLNRLFKDSVLDVTTDAQVLKTVLVQKGLSDGMETAAKGDKNE